MTIMEIRFTYVFDEKSEVIHVSREEDLGDIVQAFRLFLLGVGFHPDRVNDYVQPN